MRVQGGDSGQPVNPALPGAPGGGTSGTVPAGSGRSTQPALLGAPQRTAEASTDRVAIFAPGMGDLPASKAAETDYTDEVSLPPGLRAAYSEVAEGRMSVVQARWQYGITDEPGRQMLEAVANGRQEWSLRRASLEKLIEVEFDTETPGNHLGLIRLPRLAPWLGAGHPLDIRLLRRTFVEGLDSEWDAMPRADLKLMARAYDAVKQGRDPVTVANECGITHLYDTKLLGAVAEEFEGNYAPRLDANTLWEAQRAISAGTTAYDAAEQFGAGHSDDYRPLHLWDCAVSAAQGRSHGAVWHRQTEPERPQ